MDIKFAWSCKALGRSRWKNFISVRDKTRGSCEAAGGEGDHFRDIWGLGFATESLITILKFGFETLHLHRIECGTSVHNMASWRVIEKAGMTRGHQAVASAP